MAVTNVAGSPLAEAADLALVTQAGPELAVPATKTYLDPAGGDGRARHRAGAGPAALDAELGPGRRTRSTGCSRAAPGSTRRSRRCGDAAYAVVSGRGLMMGTALETALKLEETCLRPVRGYSYADLRHGPISVVTSGMTAVLVAAPDGPLLAPMAELAGDLAGRGATVVGIGGDAGVRRRLRRARARPRRCPRRWPRWARSSRPSWSSRGSPARSAWTPTTPAGWPRSPDRPPDP